MKAPDSRRASCNEEDADLTGESRAAKKVSDGQEGAQSPPQVTREIRFHALRSHRERRAFRAEFGIERNSSALLARISKVTFVGRALPRLAAPECIYHALRCVLRRCPAKYFAFPATFSFQNGLLITLHGS